MDDEIMLVNSSHSQARKYDQDRSITSSFPSHIEPTEALVWPQGPSTPFLVLGHLKLGSLLFSSGFYMLLNGTFGLVWLVVLFCFVLFGRVSLCSPGKP